MSETMLTRPTYKERLSTLVSSKARRAVVSVIAAAALTMAMVVPAWAAYSGQMRSPWEAIGGTGTVPTVGTYDEPNGTLDTGATTATSDDSYVIEVTSSAFTAPSAFWSGVGVTGLAPEAIADWEVSFYNVDNYDATFTFDMDTGRTTGSAPYGPLFSGLYYEPGSGIQGSNSSVPIDPANQDDYPHPADVWNGSWTYAFRLCPYVSFNDSNESGYADELAFHWKGCFGTYFDDWTFSFDAGTALDADEDDVITLVYYGDYDVNQTSRGTDYTPDFESESTVVTYSGFTTLDNPEGADDQTDADNYSITGDVDENGIVTFSGIRYGGNYKILVNGVAV